MLLNEGVTTGEIWQGRLPWVRRTLEIFLFACCVIGLLGVPADSREGPRSFYDVIFVSPQAGWLYSGEVLGTRDGGRTWTVQRTWDSKGGIAAQMQFLDPQHGWVLYESSYLHRTADGGQTWQATRVLAKDATSSFPRGLGRLGMLSPQIGFGLSDVGTHLLRTGDGGRTWRATLIRTGTVNFTVLSFLDNRQGWVAGIGGMSARTQDGGQTLRNLPPTPVKSPLAMRFLSASNGWMLDAEGYQLFRTVDGGQSWQRCNAGQPTAEIGGFFFTSQTHGWAAAAGGVILRTTDGCLTWHAIQTPSTADLKAIHFLDAAIGWAVGEEDTVLKTTDGGLTWSPVQVNTP